MDTKIYLLLVKGIYIYDIIDSFDLDNRHFLNDSQQLRKGLKQFKLITHCTKIPV